jgi:hypothetical protein
MIDQRQEDTSSNSCLPAPEPGGSLSSAIHKELHNPVVRKMRFERVDHTLQPMALVNEALGCRAKLDARHTEILEPHFSAGITV